ncbi:MAG: hypothetical protein GXO78_11210 [Calditrichaeota bacterium]|nr:hypothetical protein [Calditrichota bacterium]
MWSACLGFVGYLIGKAADPWQIVYVAPGAAIYHPYHGIFDIGEWIGKYPGDVKKFMGD